MNPEDRNGIGHNSQNPIDKPEHRPLVPSKESLICFLKFALVGASGIIVDMGVLIILADPRMFALDITFSKVVGAEIALLNNFILNDRWTFRQKPERRNVSTVNSGPETWRGSRDNRRIRAVRGAITRCLWFHGICGTGIVMAVVLLRFLYLGLSWNLYLSNLLAIATVALWNYFLNRALTWRNKPYCSKRPHKEFQQPQPAVPEVSSE